MRLPSILAGLKKGALPHALRSVDDETFINLSYQMILRRTPDKNGLSHYAELLATRRISRETIVDQLIDSEEFTQNWQFGKLGTSLHQSRIRFIKSFPKANHIVDLGGSSNDSDFGALVELGYMYVFNSITIVDLPNDERHQLYKRTQEIPFIQSGKGRINYLYQSMCNLQPLGDNSIDLVYSGQSIEHISSEDAQKTYQEIMRVLRPGGYFCLDTPNGRITRLQQDKFIDPDHKVEYTHPQLSKNLLDAGFQIIEAKGLNYVGPIEKRAQFDAKEVAKNCGLYWDIENCYLLAYICQKPKHCQ